MSNTVTKIENETKDVEPLDNRVLEGLNSFYSFATSEQGEKLLSLVMNKSVEKQKWRHLPKYVIGGLAVLSGCTLSYFDKFDPSIAVLLGSVIGYVLGKDSNN